MISFRATIDGGSVTDRQYVATVFNEAAKVWSLFLDGDATLEGVIRLKTLPGFTVASAASFAPTQERADGLDEQATVTEIRTGIDPNGDAPDFWIDVDLAKLVNTSNPIVTLQHELGHTLTFNGFGVDAEYQTPWDARIQKTPQGYAFVGEFSGTVLLSWDLKHYTAPGLMNPYVGNVGLGYIDLAMAADSGVPIVGFNMGADYV